MRKSSQRLRRSTYWVSKKIHSWKVCAPRLAGAGDLPEAGDAGFDGEAVARASRGQSWFSSKGLGRGPTMDMSPRRTLRSWGSSSMLDLRRKRPRGVTRGSAAILNCGPFGTLQLDLRRVRWRL